MGEVFMFFLVLSDSHGTPNLIKRAWNIQVSVPDGIIFLGDGLRDLWAFSEEKPSVPIFAVRGNCDWTGSLPNGQLVPISDTYTFEGVRVFSAHGHTYSVKAGTDSLLKAGSRAKANVILYGHTHIQETHWENPDGEAIQLCNPGSLKDNGEFATLTLQNGQALIGLGQLTDIF